MNPNTTQAIENEEEGEQELEEDIDYDSVYGGLPVDTSPGKRSKDLENGYLKVFGDVAKQGIKETLIGAGGAYGDLLEFAGLSGSKKNQQKNQQDFETLQKMDQPGYQPSFSDIESLTEDQVVPESFNLPTSENLRDLNESLGGPGEAETPQGKYAARTGKLYGSGLAFGQVNPIAAVAGGVAGQAVEDLGGGPLLQAGAEIVALLASQGKGGSLVQSGKKAIQDKISQLRSLGYSEGDITLAINSAYKNSRRASVASRGAKTEQAFEDFAKNSDKIVSDILSSEIPGIEKGTQYVHQLASDAYGQVAKEAGNLTITNSKPFLKASKEVVDDLQKTLGKNQEAQAFIKRISEAAMDATQYPTADNFMNFYKELNSMGNWLGRSQKDRLINKLKDGIKDTFKAEGKKGKELADRFEKVNQGVRKAYQAEDVHNIIQKATTQDGIDYKKLYKAFDNPENVKLMEDVLGKTQTGNLKLISQTGKEVKDFDKAWKAVNFKLGTGADVVRGAAASYYIYQGDWEGLVKVVATKAGTAAVKKLAEKSLTDPRFQNLLIKGLHAIKSSSPQTFKSSNEAMTKYLADEGIDIPLD